MELSYIRQGGHTLAEVTGPEPVLTDAQSALELAMAARHAAGADRLLVDKAAVAGDFFILSTGLAGEILQKFVNYQVKMAVYGDFSRYAAGADRLLVDKAAVAEDFFILSTGLAGDL